MDFLETEPEFGNRAVGPFPLPLVIPVKGLEDHARTSLWSKGGTLMIPLRITARKKRASLPAA